MPEPTLTRPGATRLLPLILLATTALSAAQSGAPRVNLTSVWVSAVKQTVTLTYNAVLPFPLGPRAARTVLDCTTGQIVTRGYQFSNEFLSADNPDGPEDREGATALLKTDAVKLGNAAVRFTSPGGSLRFSCRNGVAVTDISSYASQPKGMLGFFKEHDVAYSSFGGTFPIGVTMPGYSFMRSDDILGTANLNLYFKGATLTTATLLVDVKTNRPFDGEREALFLLEPDGKTLRPIQYGRTELGLGKFVPVKAGKGGTQVVVYYTPDYQGSEWQKTVLDLSTYEFWTSKVTKPSNLKFGK